MLEYSTYSVISPEGCASILWKSADKATDAAEALGITSQRLRELGLIDRIVKEPLGGAHRNVEQTAVDLKQALTEELGQVRAMGLEAILESRQERLMHYGQFQE